MRPLILAAAAMLASAPALAITTPPIIDLDSPGIEGIPYPHVMDVRQRAELCRGYDDHTPHRFFTDMPGMWRVRGFGSMRTQIALSEPFFDWSECTVPIGFYVHGGRLVRQRVRP